MHFSKKLIAAMLLVTTASAATAQDASQSSPSPSPAPQASTPSQTSAPPSGPLKFYLEVTPEDLQAMSTALMELPKKVADPLIGKLNAQLQDQTKINAAREQAMKAPEAK